MRYITFALGKGRLAEKTLEMFEQIGITCEEMKDKKTRKLIFVNEELGLRFFLAKGPDVPTYVEYGAADIGVVGKDTIMEEGRNIPLVMSWRRIAPLTPVLSNNTRRSTRKRLSDNRKNSSTNCACFFARCSDCSKISCASLAK